jgi:hypothetical protein
VVSASVTVPAAVVAAAERCTQYVSFTGARYCEISD